MDRKREAGIPKKKGSSILKKALAIDNSRCTGCRNCELACSVEHTQTFNPRRSRIQVLKKEKRDIIMPVVCLQCENPLCQEACPTGAIHRNEEEILTVNPNSCIGCGNCVNACIYGGIAIDPITLKAIKCDLCGGNPACVEACEYDAISVVTLDGDGLRERAQGVGDLAKKYGLVREEA
ncbi:MAG: 4Fe-4S dicluster domain-containing protein [Candidatus Lokiarchaeota archaeon]|nr:4Fe-4S dicluster domain-containing protein [Candidatus Lokiarchaeota archaeon]